MTDPLRSEKDLHVVQISLQELEEDVLEAFLPKQRILTFPRLSPAHSSW